MSLFRATKNGVKAKFDANDAQTLASLAAEVAALLAGRDEYAGDPALDRLLPSAYPDSEEDAAEFRRFTEQELCDDKVAGALSMATTLSAPPVDGRVRVRLDVPTAVGWLRSLTDIRLVLATRIGIDEEGKPPALSERDRFSFAVYNWLGAMQWTLVKAVDR
jgi:Domain of unknown function (DUF2017)